jgi:hypothetical protein
MRFLLDTNICLKVRSTFPETKITKLMLDILSNIIKTLGKRHCLALAR